MLRVQPRSLSSLSTNWVFCNIQVTESTPENRKLVRLSLLRRVYSSVCRAVLKSDKMAAALHIVREMQPQLFKSNASLLFR